MATIQPAHGNLLRADAEALVNTVNTVGVMGKGVALQFRKAFPDNYKAYKRACDAGEVVPGKMFVFETGQLTGPRLIINFPTKRHWKGRARIEDIRSGLVDLVRVLREWHVGTVAVPPLGCGNGRLDWREVRPLIEQALSEVDGLRVLLYQPEGAPEPQEQQIATERPNMSPARAVLLVVLETYRKDPAVAITMLVVQKLAYLLQAAGQPLKLNFVKGTYGPYAEALNHVLQGMDGHFIKGAGDRTQPTELELVPEAVNEAWDFLGSDEATKRRIDRVCDLIMGFESPLGLELLTTVHWAAEQDRSTSLTEALRVVQSWTERKRRTFQEHHVVAAWERLRDQGWIHVAAGAQ